MYTENPEEEDKRKDISPMETEIGETEDNQTITVTHTKLKPKTILIKNALSDRHR